MIRHSEAAKFLAAVSKSHGKVTLAELRGETPVGGVLGTGSISLKKGRYRIKWRLPDEEKTDDLQKWLAKEWGKPKTYTQEDRWQMIAVTEDGLCLEFKVFPPATRDLSNHRLISINLQTSQLKVVKAPVDPEEEAAFIAKVQALGINWSGTVDTDAPPKEALHHAVLVGIESPLRRQRATTTKITNDFLGEAGSGWKNDTWMLERDGMTFALIQKKKKLHAYLRFEKPECSEEEQETRFSAFLDAIAFTHGCRPWPLVREVCHGHQVVKCEIFTKERISQTSSAPMTDCLMAFHEESESMIQAAFDFYRSGSPLIKRFNRLHSLLCEAHEGTTIRETDMLALCTVFEGLIGCLFDHRRLKEPTRTSIAAAQFTAATDAVREWLKQKDEETGGSTDSPWDRLIGFIKSCGYVRTQEKLKAVAEFYGISWNGDMAEVFRMWKKQRNPLAHGSGREEGPNGMREMFHAWSRITGTINRLMLAEMGYNGCFCYSRMESGMEVLEIRPTPPETVMTAPNESLEVNALRQLPTNSHHA